MFAQCECRCRLHDDKRRLLLDVYEKGARIHHLETLLKVSQERNGGLIEQAESAKARKLTSEKRMHGMEAHVADLEEKLSKYRSKLDGQLKVSKPHNAAHHCGLCCGPHPCQIEMFECVKLSNT